jgi:hypothetical protein
MDDEYLIDDAEELNEDGYFNNSEEQEDENPEEFEEELKENPEDVTLDESQKGKLTERELDFILKYDDIKKEGKAAGDNMLLDMLTIIVASNPQHSSQKTINDLVRSILGKTGKNRVTNSIYTPDEMLSGQDVDEDFLGDDASKFNRELIEEARSLIADFIDFLANRDLSKDSAFSKRRKLRQIPAFIIFLFSSGLYDLILNCPTMPKEYDDQINHAFQVIMKTKYDIVEQLAREYEARGRQIVADRVRKLGLAWFDREPAEIRILSDYQDLGLTYDDVVLYREFRSKFTNTSKTITQDTISDLIEVYQDPEAGIYEKLKDKTRSEAISDVKQVWKNWISDNARDSDLAKKIIWKSI